MTDDEYLEEQRKERAESVEYFRTSNKLERERWVAQTFLSNSRLNYTSTEVIQGEDPPDIRFRDANFEIKEILDPGRRRHQEYKEGLDKAINATTPADLVRPAPFNGITISTVYALILESAQELAARKYPLDLRRKLDLLFYVNLLNTYEFIETPYPDVTTLTAFGWRSISFIKGYRSCVLTAADDAPASIRNAIGRIVHRDNENEDTPNL
jgi:Putative endonuclease, protein of unknown function (DUF1780)